MKIIQTQCCIVGGGPAGMMLGFLLARAGVDVVVLEKHADFLRDFRGDTIHPSTLEVFYELGLLDELLKRPHQQLAELHGFVGKAEITVADFSKLKTKCRFIAMMPQWDFLNFVAGQASRYPTFRLRMSADVAELIEEAGCIVGVRAHSPEGPCEIRCGLTVGADGRSSTVRQCAGLKVRNLGAPIDVLWMRISRRPTDPDQAGGRFDRGRILAMIFRGDYWQCGFVIPKGGYDAVRARGLDAFRREIATIAPFIADRVHELRDWDAIKLLTVKVDRLKRWHRPGLLCIGDAAHAMSPVGGVGINLAIQDAVAAANLLAQPLLRGTPHEQELACVERRRWFPTWVTQRLQVFAQDRIIGKTLSSSQSLQLPWQLRLLRRFPYLRRIPARLVGVGVRPEHIQTAEAFPGTR